MRVCWQGTIHVSPPVEKVYAYLADFSKHPEWSGTVTRLECTKPGDERGIGAQYIAYEHVDFVPEGWRRLLPRAKEARSFSEVIELVPSQRIARGTLTRYRMWGAPV